MPPCDVRVRAQIGDRRFASRWQVLSQKHDEFQEAIKKLGLVPKEAFDETHSNLTVKRLVDEINSCNKELQALCTPSRTCLFSHLHLCAPSVHTGCSHHRRRSAT